MSDAMESMLTTVDNPYDPFEQFELWSAWDTEHGYNSSAFLARLTYQSYDLSEADQRKAIEVAIDEIVAENICGMWRKVSRPLADA